jgi:hypothetical protein
MNKATSKKIVLGISENTVKVQFWSAVSTYLHIEIIKKVLNIEASHYLCYRFLK